MGIVGRKEKEFLTLQLGRVQGSGFSEARSRRSEVATQDIPAWLLEVSECSTLSDVSGPLPTSYFETMSKLCRQVLSSQRSPRQASNLPPRGAQESATV